VTLRRVRKTPWHTARAMLAVVTAVGAVIAVRVVNESIAPNLH
jgi:hypothetical protein